MKVSFSTLAVPASGTVILPVVQGKGLGPLATELDAATGGMLARAMKEADWAGENGQLLEILAPNGVKNGRVYLLGLGKAKELTAAKARRAGAEIVKRANAARVKDATLVVDRAQTGDLADDDLALALAEGALLRNYRFDKYRSGKGPKGKKDKKEKRLEKLSIAVAGAAAIRKRFTAIEAVTKGVHLTRDLVTEPPNTLNPESFAKLIETELTPLGVTVEILTEKQMKKLGMAALLGVGQGSTHESRLVVMRYDGPGSDKEAAPVAFVGKGVTFDSGGLSLKPAKSMEDMKFDMGGAGNVVGLMAALAGRQAKARVVGVVGLVENMPDGTAQRPGDVVTSMSGQTIEILNTDAEGRLVLADALWYTQDRFKPAAMIDLATLTGAMIVALGHEHAGLFSNDDDLATQITEAGLTTGETVWRLPLGAAYDKQIDSRIADMKNIGSGGAGSITAAQFLQRFTNDVPWAHLDIAGTVWIAKDQPFSPAGATGHGVRLLDRYVADVFETDRDA